MGRGRQKAKHQKVARELKYHTSDIDVSALKRELSTGGGADRMYSDHRSSTAVDDPYGGPPDGDDDDED